LKNKTEQMSFEHIEADNGPVVCLGMTFENEEARREYFRDELRKKLPELKKIEGFPIGEDEDIITLSDPPYYTACPNPWINEFISMWTSRKELQEMEISSTEPFIADVSEGKNDLIYNVHTYHTKVPYKAIMRYILHYTEPGDVIFDGFSGSGMTGVAAFMCGVKEQVESLGYLVEGEEPLININENNNQGDKKVKVGHRNAILNDLSPMASFIAYNYNTPNKSGFKKNALEFLSEMEEELGFLYSTFAVGSDMEKEVIVNKIKKAKSINELKEVFKEHKNHMGKINYVVWSDTFICPYCTNTIVYSDKAVDYEKTTVLKEFNCPSCGGQINKRNAQHFWEERYDIHLRKVIKQAKQVPYFINYTFNNKRFEKEPDELDKNLIEKISELIGEFDVSVESLPNGYNTRQPIESHGFTHVHHFYTERNLAVLSTMWQKLSIDMKWILTAFLSRNATKMNRYVINKHNPKGRINGPLTGTLYIPSLIVEQSIFQLFKDKVFEIEWNTKGNLLQVSSSTDLNIPSDSIDYIFLDPPFGANIMYSEVNFIWESWLKVKTNNNEEAIQNNVQGKDLTDYKVLMVKAFKECYRILKPGKWMTIEFSNTQASVWNAIQLAIQEAGFVVANVSILDKKHGGIRAMTNLTSVKQDLVISSYKPKTELFSKVNESSKYSRSDIWGFVRQHLEYLPKFIGKNGQAQIIVERDPRIIYDRLIAHFVSLGKSIPMSSSEFQEGLRERFVFRDGMIFTEAQIVEYDRKKVLVKDFAQMSLFVSDENSAIEWIRQQLLKKPQTRQDIHPNYMREIQHIAKHELLPELDDLLNQNFLRYDGDGNVPDQIASYLRKNYKDLRGLEAADSVLIDRAMNRWYVPDPNKQADLEKLREKSLLREFQSYLDELESSKKKLKQFRTEAIRAGFKKAYSEKDFEKIVKVGDRLPESVIQEDDKLLMYYDNACIRLGL